MLFTFIIGSFFRIFFVLCSSFLCHFAVQRDGVATWFAVARLLRVFASRALVRLDRPSSNVRVIVRRVAVDKHETRTSQNARRKSRCEQDDRNARAYIPRKKDIRTNCIVICHSGSGSPGRLVVSSDARGAVHSLFVPCSCAKLNSTQTFVQQVSRIERHISISSTDKVNYADICMLG